MQHYKGSADGGGGNGGDPRYEHDYGDRHHQYHRPPDDEDDDDDGPPPPSVIVTGGLGCPDQGAGIDVIAPSTQPPMTGEEEVIVSSGPGGAMRMPNHSNLHQQEQMYRHQQQQLQLRQQITEGDIYTTYHNPAATYPPQHQEQEQAQQQQPHIGHQEYQYTQRGDHRHGRYADADGDARVNHNYHHQQRPPPQQQGQHHHQHDYGSPNGENRYDDDFGLSGGDGGGGESSSSVDSSCGGWCANHCCCWTCLVRTFARSFLCAENLQRAFCFGAIDGMLTGSGIAAASVGLGKFDPYGPLPQRLAVVGLALAACTADGLCMGLGHVWSTHVMHENAEREREEETWTFRNRRGVSKARLVDTLLSRGMLKIDAMSIADTLEGYPDIFVSALVGDAHAAGPLGLVSGSGTGEDDGGGQHQQQHQQQQHHRGAPPSMSELGDVRDSSMLLGLQYYSPDQHNDQDGRGNYGGVDRDLYGAENDDGRGGGRGSSWSRPFLTESRNEGIVMMVAFSTFAVLPALIHAFVPMWVNHPVIIAATAAAASDGDGGNVLFSGGSDDVSYKPPISSTSLTVTITAVIMLLLGFWKSKFFASNWIIFGVETVLVLMFCIVAAYGVGWVAARLLLS